MAGTAAANGDDVERCTAEVDILLEAEAGRIDDMDGSLQRIGDRNLAAADGEARTRYGASPPRWRDVWAGTSGKSEARPRAKPLGIWTGAIFTPEEVRLAGRSLPDPVSSARLADWLP